MKSPNSWHFNPTLLCNVSVTQQVNLNKRKRHNTNLFNNKLEFHENSHIEYRSVGLKKEILLQIINIW